jgi:hypothetical protein
MVIWFRGDLGIPSRKYRGIDGIEEQVLVAKLQEIDMESFFSHGYL